VQSTMHFKDFGATNIKLSFISGINQTLGGTGFLNQADEDGKLMVS